ncbi:MAG: hypothetical protein K2Q12_02540 [Rickettsiales bacterium]|nr:hypothetical protein [Rickettsiales bacterium]
MQTMIHRANNEPVAAHLEALRDTKRSVDEMGEVFGALTPVCYHLLMMTQQNRVMTLNEAQKQAARHGLRALG